MRKPRFTQVLRVLALLECTAVLAACGVHGNAPALPAGGIPLGAERAAGQVNATSRTVVMAGVDSPRAVAVDAAGNVVVADTGNNRIVKLGADGSYDSFEPGLSVLRSIATNGVVTYVTDGRTVKRIVHHTETTVGSGWAAPNSVALDRFGSLYVAELSGVVRKITTDGTTTTIGSKWNTPSGVAVDRTTGDVYVVDRGAGTLNKVAQDGSVSVIAAGFQKSENIAADWRNGDVYVAEPFSNRIVKVTPDGNVTPVGSGFKTPYGVAIDPNGKLYIADTGNSDVRTIATDGKAATIAGFLKSMRGIALDPSGNLYVVNDDALRKIDLAEHTLTTIGSGFTAPYGITVDAGYTVYFTEHRAVKRISLNGTVVAVGAGWGVPKGVAVERSTGDVYVADSAYGIVKVKPQGAMSAVGSGWKDPVGIALDSRNRDMYVVDPGLGALLRMTPSGTVTTVADRLKAEFVAIDEKNGYAWVTEPSVNAIKRVAPDGSIWTVGDGSAIEKPYGIAVDKSGNVYVADAGDYVIWKLTF